MQRIRSLQAKAKEEAGHAIHGLALNRAQDIEKGVRVVTVETMQILNPRTRRSNRQYSSDYMKVRCCVDRDSHIGNRGECSHDRRLDALWERRVEYQVVCQQRDRWEKMPAQVGQQRDVGRVCNRFQRVVGIRDLDRWYELQANNQPRSKIARMRHTSPRSNRNRGQNRTDTTSSRGRLKASPAV